MIIRTSAAPGGRHVAGTGRRTAGGRVLEYSLENFRPITSKFWRYSICSRAGSYLARFSAFPQQIPDFRKFEFKRDFGGQMAIRTPALQSLGPYDHPDTKRPKIATPNPDTKCPKSGILHLTFGGIALGPTAFPYVHHRHGIYRYNVRDADGREVEVSICYHSYSPFKGGLTLAFAARGRTWIFPL